MKGAAGVVAAGHECTADAADAVLRAGGNAYDAVLAAVTTACVAEPVLASLGGGGFLLAAPADGPARVYDFFVQTPAQRRGAAEIDFYPITADFGTAQQEFHIGAGTMAVPGLAAGLFEVHRDLATVPMRELVQPALALARDGVPITAFQAYLFSVIAPTFTATAPMRAIYGSRRGGTGLLEEGEVLRQPAFADALETLAVEGPDLFYRGEIARAILAVAGEGGQVGAADLDAYRVERHRPLTADYHGARLLTNPPPSSGGLLIAFALRLLDDVLPAGGESGSPSHLGAVADALDLTSEARVETHADEGYADESVLLCPDLLARYRAEIAGRAASRRGTTHLSVIDAAGNLASLTVSNGEGCGHVAPGTGIVLNNMLGEEDLNPGGFHRWPLAHRMTSMMAPSALLWPDGRRIATGSGGSNRIRSAVLQVIVNLVDFGLAARQAVDAPRIHYERGLLSVEGGVREDALKGLAARHPEPHLWGERNMFFGGAHTAGRHGSGFEGAGDPRRGGASTVVGA